MDNRLRFLYCGMSELWGRMCKARAGNGKTRTSAGAARKENPPGNARALRGPKGSREARGACAENSRYRAYRTRTVNRHR